VDPQDLAELHYITPIVNVPSICRHGILSHQRAQRVQHDSVALQDVQDRRSRKQVPLADGSSRPLHSYVNLYMHARNPMLFRRKSEHADLCVLRISCDVLDIPGTVIADGNAPSGLSGFHPSPAGLARVDLERVFARWWRHEDQIRHWEQSRVKCAEVLVPDCVPPEHRLGVYVSCPSSEQRLRALAADTGMALEVTIDADLFFQ